MRNQENVGQTDRLLRVILGIYAMLFGFLFAQGVAGAIIGVIGLASLVTGILGWCGIYAILGKSTVKESDNEQVQESQASDDIAQEDQAESDPESEPEEESEQEDKTE